MQQAAMTVIVKMCHFFSQRYMDDPFDADGKIQWMSAYQPLNYSEKALTEQIQER